MNVILLKIGEHLLDLLDPKPELIDLPAIEQRLWTVRRFSGCPKALVIRQHTGLVSKLALMMGEPFEVVRWCEHHDDHEGIIGDIPGPLKSYIEKATIGTFRSLSDIELGLDHAICAARKIAPPTAEIRQRVHFYDKLAETLEWRFVLGEPVAPWNKPFENWMNETRARAMAAEAQNDRPPEGWLSVE